MYRPKNEILLAVMELYDIEFVVFNGEDFGVGYKVVVKHGGQFCQIRTPDRDFFSTWDREREEAERYMADLMQMGATVCCGSEDTYRQWKIPHFSTIEELHMKANIVGETHD